MLTVLYILVTFGLLYALVKGCEMLDKAER